MYEQIQTMPAQQWLEIHSLLIVCHFGGQGARVSVIKVVPPIFSRVALLIDHLQLSPLSSSTIGVFALEWGGRV